MAYTKYLQVVLLLLAITTPSADGYKVLVLGPVGSRSLYHLCRAVSEALGQSGHSVTLVSSFVPSGSLPNVTELYTGSNSLQKVNLFASPPSPLRVYRWATHMTEEVGRAMWSRPEIMALWHRRREFDAIVIIGYGNEVATPFLMDFEGLYVGLCTPGVEYLHLATLGNRLPLSVIPAIFLPFDEHMSFFERLINPWAQLITHYTYFYTVIPTAQRVLQEYFPDIPRVEDLYWGIHMTLINGHYALDTPVPLLPNQVEIGTINAKRAGPLPRDLNDFVEGSGEEGVIYFSLGSIGRSSDMPRKYKDMFIAAFGRLPQRVIWKYEGDDLDLPPNVIIRSWLPQQDVLGHPKTRLFISHCGNLGTQEAKYHGVPILAVPITFDQHRNAARLVKKGFGRVLNWEEMEVERIIESVNVMLSDESYHARLQEVSSLLQDQKESPSERAVWWIEYMIRHKHSTHLDYPGRKLHYLQYSMVDVFLVWVGVFALLGWGVWRCVGGLGRAWKVKWE